MSVEKQIKNALLSGEVLTSCTVAREFLTADLRKYISNLRKSGLAVRDRKKVGGNGKVYKEYFIA